MNFAISYNHQWIVKNVRNFCKIIQKNDITFLQDDSALSYFNNIQVFKIFSKENIKLKMVKNFNDIPSEEFLVTSYYTDNTNQADNWITIFAQRSVKSALVILKKKYLNDFTHLITSKNLTLDIYVSVILDSQNDLTEFKEIISMRNQSKILIQNATTTNLNKKVDLQGIHITSISGNWWPYFNIPTKCFQTKNNIIKNCNSFDGFLVDFMNQAAKNMNFTWNIEISEDWGMSPKSGKNHLKNVRISFALKIAIG